MHQIKTWLQINRGRTLEIQPVHHLLFWSIYFIFNTLRWGNFYNDYLFSLKGNLVGFPVHILLSYFTLYYLIPKFIYKRKFFYFTVLLLGAIFILIYIKYLLTYALISQNVWPEGPATSNFFNSSYLITMMLGELYVISFCGTIKITIDWLKETRRSNQLEQDRLESELRFLRAQVSPHFFFNTLNNIYALSLMKSERTPETVLKLSDLMRYFLYETRESLQCLEKEIQSVKNYLDLQRIRYSEEIKIDLVVEGEPKGHRIAPMMLITFVENCFKHGADKSTEPISIKISYLIKNGWLFYEVRNSLPKEKPILPKSGITQGGIGINNVKKRLALGYQPDEYHLEQQETESEYIVKLNIKLR